MSISPLPANQGISERIMMGLMIGGIAYGCLLILYPFFSALLWAGILSYVTWPVYIALRTRIGRISGAIIMMILSALLIVLPLALMASTLNTSPESIQHTVVRITDVLHLPPLPHFIVQLPTIGPKLNATWSRWSQNISTIGDLLSPYVGSFTHLALSLLLQAARGLLQLVMALFIAFFFWLSGEGLGQTINAIIYRIAGTYAQRLLHVTSTTIRGTVYGVIGTAIVQGILTGFGFAIVKIPNPVFFGSIAAFLSVLPIGAPVIWIPAGIWLLLSHHITSGILLLIYGIVIISGADHFLRPMFISRGARLPYLLSVLGVLGGVVAFGGIGIFLGPVLLGVGYTLAAEFANGAPLNQHMRGGCPASSSSQDSQFS